MILIVDDDPAVARAHARLLRSLGHETHCVHDGVSAIAYATQHKPDVIVLDLEMPGMHGFDLLKALKSEPATVPIPVVVCSASGNPLDRGRALAMGAADYAEKLHVDWAGTINRLLPGGQHV